MTTPAPTGEQQPTSPAPQQQPTAPTPPWGDDFDAQRAWNLVQSLRGDKEKLKGDLTQAAADREELEQLRTEKLSADEKALKNARKEAAEAATKETAAAYLPRIQALEVKALAGAILDKDQLKGFMEIVNPAAFVGADGEIDEAKVMGALTAMFGQRQAQQQVYGPRWQNAGQGAAAPPRQKPGEAGRAEAKRRAEARKTNTT